MAWVARTIDLVHHTPHHSPTSDSLGAAITAARSHETRVQVDKGLEWPLCIALRTEDEQIGVGRDRGVHSSGLINGSQEIAHQWPERGNRGERIR